LPSTLIDELAHLEIVNVGFTFLINEVVSAEEISCASILKQQINTINADKANLYIKRPFSSYDRYASLGVS
jgi:hypothetical protein